MATTRDNDLGIPHHERVSRPVGGQARRIPADPHALPRDVGPCSICGEVELLAPGSDLCPSCDDFGRAAAQARRPVLAQAALRAAEEAERARRARPGAADAVLAGRIVEEEG